MCSDAPCDCDCPAGVDARAFIRKIRFENLEGAVRLLRRGNVLAASCAWICPSGALCSKGCLAAGLSRPIDIAGLQLFVMEWERAKGMIEPRSPKRDGFPVAVVGSGPAGLGAAAELALRGHLVTLFESSDLFGGVLRQHIPSWRLPDDVVDFDLDFIRRLGVEFVTGKEIADPKMLLAEGYRAVFLGTGLDRPQEGDILNAKLPGVFQALDLLRRTRLGEALELGGRAVVIGGGDSALDAARTIRRQGKECIILYRRTKREMPAYGPDAAAAWEEGIEFFFRVIVRAVVGEGRVQGVRCVRIRWNDPIPGERRGWRVEGAEFVIPCESVVLAMGQMPASTFGLRTTPKGFVAVDHTTMMTSEPGVFAGGDLAFGGGTAARAVGQGREAAERMDAYVRGGADHFSS